MPPGDPAASAEDRFFTGRGRDDQWVARISAGVCNRERERRGQFIDAAPQKNRFRFTGFGLARFVQRSVQGSQRSILA